MVIRSNRICRQCSKQEGSFERTFRWRQWIRRVIGRQTGVEPHSASCEPEGPQNLHSRVRIPPAPPIFTALECVGSELLTYPPWKAAQNHLNGETDHAVSFSIVAVSSGLSTCT